MPVHHRLPWIASLVAVVLLCSNVPAAEDGKQERDALAAKVALLEKRIKELEDRLAKLEPQAAAKPVELNYTPTDVDKAVAKKLKEKLPVNFEGNKLVNVLDYFRNTTGINFYVDWARLEAAGVEMDLPVTLQLSNVPAETALKLVVQQIDGGAELDPLAYAVVDGVVVISTKRGLAALVNEKVKFKDEK